MSEEGNQVIFHIKKSTSWKQSCKNQFAKIERWFWSVILQGKAHICDLSKQENEETILHFQWFSHNQICNTSVTSKKGKEGQLHNTIAFAPNRDSNNITTHGIIRSSKKATLITPFWQDWSRNYTQRTTNHTLIKPKSFYDATVTSHQLAWKGKNKLQR